MNKISMVSLIMAFVMIFGFTTTSMAVGSLGQDVAENLKSITTKVTDEVISTVSNVVSKVVSDIFFDIKEMDWYSATIQKLVDLGGINGYPDGTFKPNNQITRAEFTKILVSALGYENLPATSSHWASGYVDKAVAINLSTRGELSDLNRAIPRKEMAKMVANALDHRGESQVADRAIYKSQITDYNKISSSYQEFVLKAYTKGIITGYPDGSFGGDKGLTRAEASTVIIRVLDTSERKVPNAPMNESGPNVDLNKVNIKSAIGIDIYKKGEDLYNTDFQILIRMWEPLEPQHNDIENILKTRFGNVKEVDEIMSYIRAKKVRADELTSKWWTVNGQEVTVGSNPNSQNVSITSWYLN